ncbi:hypothetical protein GH714_043416 [Hevea brasiliensis]|uniref:LysM domain-containing protein n=1 Tax=Hevea brasiliensis TaxID=3981 RepID=A0A6A6K471_HEVBR|nr:hypothetical protein GH714_043416 [Hevea brasiliensis]
MDQNSQLSARPDLSVGSKLTVPLRCACPSTNQTAKGVISLLVYTVTWDETISSIAQRFGVDEASVLEANKLSQEGNIYPFTPILVPLTNENHLINAGNSANPRNSANPGNSTNLGNFSCLYANGSVPVGVAEDIYCRAQNKKFPTKLVAVLAPICFTRFRYFDSIRDKGKRSISATVKMRMVGLTGGIASGKSTVSELFKSHGIPVVDADLVARDVLKKDTGGYNEVVAAFGEDILEANGEVDRPKLGQIVFSDSAKRQLLNRIIPSNANMPRKRKIKFVENSGKVLECATFDFLQGCNVIVLDIPLLFETKMDKWTKPDVVVWVDTETQLQRLMGRDGSSEVDARNRITAQMALDLKRSKADIVIDNTGSLEDLKEQFQQDAALEVKSLKLEGLAESVEENEKEKSSVSLDLGRRGMILANDLDVNSVGLGLQVDSGLGIFDAFIASLSMIIVSEIGDETFIIAALMAMRHPKSIVLSGALTALIVMTVLSTGLGRIVPNLISRKHTNSAATEEKLEAGQGKTSFRRFFSRFCTPIFLESFILTFLAEWGDRSQIATIAV